MNKTVSLLVSLSLLGCAEQSSDMEKASIKSEPIESISAAKAVHINPIQFSSICYIYFIIG